MCCPWAYDRRACAFKHPDTRQRYCPRRETLRSLKARLGKSTRKLRTWSNATQP